MFAWMRPKKRQTPAGHHGIAPQKSATSLTTGGSSRDGAQRPPGSFSWQPIIYNSVADALSAGIDAKRLWKPPTGQWGSGVDNPAYLLPFDGRPIEIAKCGVAGQAAYSNPYHSFREIPGRWRLEESRRKELFPGSSSYTPADRMMSGATAIHTLPITRIEDASAYQSYFDWGRQNESRAWRGLDRASKKAMPRNAVPLDDYRKWLGGPIDKSPGWHRRPLRGHEVIYTWQTTPPLRLVNSGGAGRGPVARLPDCFMRPEVDYWIVPFRSESGEMYAEVFSPILFNPPEGWTFGQSATVGAAGAPPSESSGQALSGAGARHGATGGPSQPWGKVVYNSLAEKGQ